MLQNYQRFAPDPFFSNLKTEIDETGLRAGKVTTAYVRRARNLV
jgi:hypothetical protein